MTTKMTMKDHKTTMKSLILKLILALTLIPLASGSAFGPQPNRTEPPELELTNGPTSYQELETIFSRHNYDWGTLDEGVPSLFLKTLPQDLNKISQTKKKKTVFFLSLLPMVLRVNEDIEEQKRELQTILSRYDRQQSLTAFQQSRLAAIVADYRVSGDPLKDPRVRERLLKRVDIIPPSMVLAQAATESAYGTSRFARLGNNLFGEWTFVPGTGMVPQNRPEGMTHEVRTFPTIYASIASYMKNLNTHKAYRQLRELRARIRREGRPLQGIELAQGLLYYSQRGEAYIEEIQTIIRSNALHRVTSAMFRSRTASTEGDTTAPLPPLRKTESTLGVDPQLAKPEPTAALSGRSGQGIFPPPSV
ncbi:MAG: glucosaminidase domain-containing protein [Desulfuromonadaceae bacterium]